MITWPRNRWQVGDKFCQEGLGSPEYRAKKAFMFRMVHLFHRLGASELARQYEWWTCKSQPNVLKRKDRSAPDEGLTAVDFRAGLALLACLPMSPGDIKLVWQGFFRRHSLVQFDRSSVERLANYVSLHRGEFGDMLAALDELKRTEHAYRESQIDVTHHRLRLLHDGGLWNSIFSSTVRGWYVSNTVDSTAAKHFSGSKLLTTLFSLWVR